MPAPAEPADLARVPLADVALAAMSATRAPAYELRRRTRTRWLFLHLAREQGWVDPLVLARHCGMSRDGVMNNWGLDIELDAARLCLGDSRLLR